MRKLAEYGKWHQFGQLTAILVREIFDYDPHSGVLYWKIKRYRNNPGDVAGYYPKSAERYLRVSLNKVSYRVHRVIWLWMTGEWPEHEIDHIDGNRQNNRWSNLREATTAQNRHNSRLMNRNSSGCKGITTRRGKFRARIMLDYKEMHLGDFDTFEEAVASRKAAERLYHGEFARNYA